MTFYEKYLELCASVDKTPSGAALEMGLSKPTVNRWKNGGGITDATARKVAAYFGVPVDCLTRETDDPAPEQKEKAPQSDVDRLMEGLGRKKKKRNLKAQTSYYNNSVKMYKSVVNITYK